MKNFAILNKDKTILVKTPIPYIVNVSNKSIKELKKIQYELNDNVKFLYNCLKLLNISKKEAKKNKYTLNFFTYEKLYAILIKQENISVEFKRIFVSHKW